MLKLLIIDDEEHARKTLARTIQAYPASFNLCASCSSVSEAAGLIAETHPDVVLLDIEMGNENGFELFKHFPQPEFKTVFVTAYQHYAVKAFRFAALDYLLKPVDPAQLVETLGRASEAIDRGHLSLKLDAFSHNLRSALPEPKKIVLRTADNIHLVSLSEIVYCQADRGYTYFYLSDQSRIMVSTLLGDYEALFSDHGFLRIHQSYLLNLAYFKRYEKADGGRAILKTGTGLPVATRKKDLLLQRLSQL